MWSAPWLFGKGLRKSGEGSGMRQGLAFCRKEAKKQRSKEVKK
jgi:hypothetical protein